MEIKVRIPDRLREKTAGQSEVSVAGDTVRDCLQALIGRHPGLRGEILDPEGVLLLRWMLCVNHRGTRVYDDLDRRVEEGDVIELLPVIAGG